MYAAAALLVGACGGQGGGDNGGGGGSSGAAGGGEALDYAAFEAAWLDGHCRMAVACETFPDQATCLASLGTTEPLRYATFVDDIAAGRILFDATAAARCLTVHASPSCTQTHAARVWATDLCEGVTTGTVPTGGACFFNEECAGGGLCRSESLPCNPGRYCCFGACQPRTVVPRGGDCSAADARCVDGTRCTAGATASAPPTCAGPPDTVGTTCYRNPGCAAPLYCDVSPDTGAGSCTAPAATGERCNASSETSRTSCEDLRDKCTGTGTGTDMVPVLHRHLCRPRRARRCLWQRDTLSPGRPVRLRDGGLYAGSRPARDLQERLPRRSRVRPGHPPLRAADQHLLLVDQKLTVPPTGEKVTQAGLRELSGGSEPSQGSGRICALRPGGRGVSVTECRSS